ncbi:MAG: LpqN/LpqT family lipoprotein [Ilumatobacteraceae bacterium]|jgi:hypothetical protein
MKATFPSDISPQHPEVSIDLPDTWIVAPHANAYIAAHDPSSSPNSPTTAYVTIARVASDITLDEAVASAHRAIKSKYPKSALQRVHSGTVGGKDAKFAVISIDGKDLPIQVLHSEVSVLVATENPSMNYVVQVLCKCSAKAAPATAPVFAEIIKSLRINN